MESHASWSALEWIDTHYDPICYVLAAIILPIVLWTGFHVLEKVVGRMGMALSYGWWIMAEFTVNTTLTSTAILSGLLAMACCIIIRLLDRFGLIMEQTGTVAAVALLALNVDFVSSFVGTVLHSGRESCHRFVQLQNGVTDWFINGSQLHGTCSYHHLSMVVRRLQGPPASSSGYPPSSCCVWLVLRQYSLMGAAYWYHSGCCTPMWPIACLVRADKLLLVDYVSQVS